MFTTKQQRLSIAMSRPIVRMYRRVLIGESVALLRKSMIQNRFDAIKERRRVTSF